MANPKQTIKDYDPEVLDAFHKYVYGGVSRHSFLDRIRNFAVGGLSASAILKSLQPRYAKAQKLSADDSRTGSQYLNFSSPQN